MSNTDLRHHCYAMGYSDGEVGAFYDGYEKGRTEAIDEFAVVFNEIAIKWFNQGCIALGDIPRVAEQLKEQNENI